MELILEILAWFGAGLTLGGYYLISNKYIDVFSWKFQISTFLARICFLALDIYKEVYSFALMDFVFLIICVQTMYKLHKSKN
jgi:hypothetical protein